jgi:nicotinamidase-related amidase
MSIAVVIDVQYGFLTGGNLSVTANQGADSTFTDKIDTFLRDPTKGIKTVYFTKDMHHPINASIGKIKGVVTELDDIKINPKRGETYTFIKDYYDPSRSLPDNYSGKLMNVKKLNRKDRVGESDQLMWPVHCILPREDQWYNILVGQFKKYNEKLYNKTFATGKETKNGADLAWGLEKYDSETAAPFDYFTVYKGFGKNIDSYSAVADAYGYSTPFVAKNKGVFLTDKYPVTQFIDELNKKVNSGITDIYVMGIATNYCVERSVNDIIEFVVIPASLSGKTVKVHFVLDLTLPVTGPPPQPEWTKEAIEKRISEKFSSLLNPFNNYFVVENSVASAANAPVNSTAAPAMTGGRRIKHTKRNCKCGKTHKKCKCGKASKSHKKTRKCF